MSTGPKLTREIADQGFELKLEIAFPADIAVIDGVVNRVLAVAREMNCAVGKEFEVGLALHESLVNAIVHGAKEDPGKTVECWVGCSPTKGILIIVRDPGPGFDPAAVPNCCEGENVYANHGRGILLMNHLMDHVEFYRHGTEVRMRKQ